ncbi:hypothetical protein HU200_052704 [Digitaria exilis]|uniref:Uncharacterized protein n=1 Tax=Digitaria exilis TaxID=1010633 RepID=A0A835E5J6_9POAL|nr:hypothetical protein HU200_052704 [Digitaria exilis]
MRSPRGGARRPFAPVVVSPSRAGNQLAHEEAVLGAGAGGKVAAAKKCGAGSPPLPVPASKKTPVAAVKRAPRTTGRWKVGSCAKKCSAPAAANSPVRGVSDGARDMVRAMASLPLRSEAVQERRGGEASASRKRTMEEAMAGLPEPGEGRVKYLVVTFDRLLSLAAADDGGPEARGRGRATARATSESAPEMPPGAEEIDVSYPSIASSSEVSFPAVAGVACILDTSDRTRRITHARGQRRQRTYNSTDSSDRGSSRKVAKVTSQHPFNLRTEQRGKAKEFDFVQRLRKMQMEEERLRNPLAQGLPYTTDEPETPVKPPMKEPTEPIDLVLHSDVRAVGRAKFDHQVSCPLRCSLDVREFLRAMHRLSSILQVTERNSFMEEVRLERERQKKVYHHLSEISSTGSSCSDARTETKAHMMCYSAGG